MRFWIEDRIRTLPEYYTSTSATENYFQAASDIFFCNFKVFYRDLQEQTFRPRQTDNMNLGDCGRTLPILYFSGGRVGALLKGAQGPYPGN
jgi:hypothetical protein